MFCVCLHRLYTLHIASGCFWKYWPVILAQEQCNTYSRLTVSLISSALHKTLVESIYRNVSGKAGYHHMSCSYCMIIINDTSSKNAVAWSVWETFESFLIYVIGPIIGIFHWILLTRLYNIKLNCTKSSHNIIHVILVLCAWKICSRKHKIY